MFWWAPTLTIVRIYIAVYENSRLELTFTNSWHAQLQHRKIWLAVFLILLCFSLWHFWDFNPAVIVFNWNDCIEMNWLCFKAHFVVEQLTLLFKKILSFSLFLLRVPRWELQIGCEQQAKEGADSVHQRANSRTGGRIRPSQLFDQTEAVRNRRKPGSHGKAGEMT